MGRNRGPFICLLNQHTQCAAKNIPQGENMHATNARTILAAQTMLHLHSTIQQHKKAKHCGRHCSKPHSLKQRYIVVCCSCHAYLRCARRCASSSFLRSLFDSARSSSIATGLSLGGLYTPAVAAPSRPAVARKKQQSYVIAPAAGLSLGGLYTPPAAAPPSRPAGCKNKKNS
jgi:hypothetical protein